MSPFFCSASSTSRHALSFGHPFGWNQFNLSQTFKETLHLPQWAYRLTTVLMEATSLAEKDRPRRTIAGSAPRTRLLPSIFSFCLVEDAIIGCVLPRNKS